MYQLRDDVRQEIVEVRLWSEFSWCRAMGELELVELPEWLAQPEQLLFVQFSLIYINLL